MNITEDKFTNKSVEEIVQDVLVQHKNNVEDALIYIKDISNKDGLSMSKETTEKLNAVADVLQKNINKENDLFEGLFDVFKSKNKYDVKLLCYPPFKNEPVIFTIKDVTSLDDPRIEEYHKYMRKLHPKSTIYLDSELGRKKFYENSIHDYKIKLYDENCKLSNESYAGNLFLAKAFAEKLCELNSISKAEILKENDVVSTYNSSNKKWNTVSKTPMKSKTVKTKNVNKKSSKPNDIISDFFKNKTVQDIETIGLSNLIGIDPALINGITKPFHDYASSERKSKLDYKNKKADLNNEYGIKETINDKKDLDIEFLIDHGINPSVYTKSLPLYNPETNGLIILSGIDKNSPYFKENQKDDRNKKCFSDDKVFIKTVSENRDKDQNFYTKDYGTPEAIFVDKFIDIYKDEKNKNTLDDINSFDLDTDEDKSKIKNIYFTNRKNQEDSASKAYQDWIKVNKDSGELNDIFDANISDNQKENLLKKTYYKVKNGIKIEDVMKYFVSYWLYEIENKKTLDLIKEKIRTEITDPIIQKQLILDLNDELKRCFKQNLNGEAVLLQLLGWYKNSLKKESVIDEAGFFNNQDKSKPISDPHEVKSTLKKIGIDPKFVTVPITIEAIGDNVFGKPQERLIIKRFADENKLDDKYGLVMLKDIDTNAIQWMNIGKLKEYIAKDINKDTELDTVDYRLKAGNQFNTLNPGYGEFIEIPEDIIIEMLQTVNKEMSDKYPFDLISYYKDENLLHPNKQVLNALNDYNVGNSEYVIRRFPNKVLNRFVYKGFVPHDDTGGKARPAMGKSDYFKKTMDM